MEINKIIFENLKNLNIDSTFEELDLNSDGIINANDLTLAEENTIKEQIQRTLDYVDNDNIDEIEDNNLKNSMKNLEDIQEDITKKNEEINLTQNLIKTKENKKANLQKEQKEIEEEILELQGNLSIAEGDDAKRNIQKQIITKSTENLSILNQIVKLNRTISAKTSEIELLSQGVKDLEEREGTLVEELEKNKPANTDNNKPANTDNKKPETSTKKNNKGKNKYGLKALNNKNFANAFDGTSGVQYVILSLPSCSRCHNLMKKLASTLSADKLKNIAAYNISVVAESTKYMQNLLSNMNNCNEKSIYGQYPKVLKLIDGKPTELIEFSSVPNLQKMIIKNVGQES